MTAVGGGEPLSYVVAPHPLSWVACAGPAWIGLHPGNAASALPLVLLLSVAVKSLSPTSSLQREELGNYLLQKRTIGIQHRNIEGCRGGRRCCLCCMFSWLSQGQSLSYCSRGLRRGEQGKVGGWE